MEHQVYHSIDKEIFHVHTSRCGHAENVADSEYVEKALSIKAKRIVFADHCPFPGDPFDNRMKMEELPQYLESINDLKKKYGKKIEVLCALEVEYLPSFWDYYLELKANKDIDFLILGQHFFEYEKGHYSFSDRDRSYEYKGQCKAMVEGINSGLFDVVAHPDRAFRKCFLMDEEEMDAAKELIWAAAWNGVYLEKNRLSIMNRNHYREEFWDLVPPKALVLKGLDAHAVEDIVWF